MKTQIQNFWFRLLTNLNFWLTLWFIMFAYFFLVGFLNLVFGSHLIPDFLLTIATFVKVSTILTCLIYTAFFAPQDYLLKAALLFTFTADVILAIDNISPFGIILFCFAQYFHTSRYADVSPKFFIAWSFFIIYLYSFLSNSNNLCRWLRLWQLTHPQSRSGRPVVKAQNSSFPSRRHL